LIYSNSICRVRVNPEYREKLFIRVSGYFEEWKSLLKKSIGGMTSLDGSQDICFDYPLFLPQGLECSVEVKVSNPSWYKQLSQPAENDFCSLDGQKVLDNICFEVSGKGKKVPEVCPVSKVFLKVVDPECILLQNY